MVSGKGGATRIGHIGLGNGHGGGGTEESHGVVVVRRAQNLCLLEVYWGGERDKRKYMLHKLDMMRHKDFLVCEIKAKKGTQS